MDYLHVNFVKCLVCQIIFHMIFINSVSSGSLEKEFPFQFLKNTWIVEGSNFVMIFTILKNVWIVE